MNVIDTQFILASLSMLAISARAMDVDLMNVETNKKKRTEHANLRMIYENNWNPHYEQHDIIKILGLNEQYAKSIQNIHDIGYSSVENYVDNEIKYAHPLELPGWDCPDLLIVTNMTKHEDIASYLIRQEVRNFNYIILENLMMWILVYGSDYSVDELLAWIVNAKIRNRLASIPNKEEIKKIMSKVNKSAQVVKKYVEAGALDEFMLSCADYLKDSIDILAYVDVPNMLQHADFPDNEGPRDYEELPSSFEQDVQNSINKGGDDTVEINKGEDDTVDINTEEGKKITTKLVTSMYNLAEIYKSAQKQKRLLYFLPEDRQNLLSIAQQTKNSLNEFQEKVEGGTSPRELVRALGCIFRGSGDEDYKNEPKEDKDFDEKDLLGDLRLSHIWRLLEQFDGEITADWLHATTQFVLSRLQPYLEKYLVNAKKINNRTSQIYVKKRVS